jgi:hypothetical protein
MSEWIDGDTAPDESGYYLTLHYYKETQENMVKAFWYSTKDSRWYYPNYEPQVICWWNVGHDYYMPCQLQDDVEPIPEKYR